MSKVPPEQPTSPRTKEWLDRLLPLLSDFGVPKNQLQSLITSNNYNEALIQDAVGRLIEEQTRDDWNVFGKKQKQPQRGETRSSPKKRVGPKVQSKKHMGPITKSNNDFRLEQHRVSERVTGSMAARVADSSSQYRKTLSDNIVPPLETKTEPLSNISSSSASSDDEVITSSWAKVAASPLSPVKVSANPTCNAPESVEEINDIYQHQDDIAQRVDQPDSDDAGNASYMTYEDSGKDEVYKNDLPPGLDIPNIISPPQVAHSVPPVTLPPVEPTPTRYEQQTPNYPEFMKKPAGATVISDEQVKWMQQNAQMQQQWAYYQYAQQHHHQQGGHPQMAHPQHQHGQHARAAHAHQPQHGHPQHAHASPGSVEMPNPYDLYRYPMVYSPQMYVPHREWAANKDGTTPQYHPWQLDARGIPTLPPPTTTSYFQQINSQQMNSDPSYRATNNNNTE